MQSKKLLSLALILCMGTFFTACTTTKHVLKRTEKVKVYKASEVLKSYGFDKPKGKYDTPVTFDANYLMGFSFTEQRKENVKNQRVEVSAAENPLYVEKTYVNIDLCKNWKKTSSVKNNSLEVRAYGKVYSSFNPTPYKLFISLEDLKKRGLVPSSPSKQEDICIYMDDKTMGHSGVFKDKSNKIHYKASEINNARKELENK